MRVDHLIAGKRVASQRYLNSINPATQDVVAEVALGGQAEVHARYPGRVMAMTVELGQRVSRGQVVARVESSESLQTYSVTAPISGRIGRSLVTEGALVGQGQVTELAVIQQVNPLYVNVTQSSSDILRMRAALNAGKLAKAGDNAAKVTVYTDDGKPYAHEGKLLFTDLTVDPTTGQVSVRAELPNPDGMLLPGMYVRVHIQEAQVDNAVLVPQQAVTRNEKGNTVMVVADDGSVSPRPVQISQSSGTNWVVTDGLKAGDKVMVDGFTKLGMGAKKVTPVAWKANAGSAPAAAPAPAAEKPAAEAPAASK